jgi:hypothetical protein
MFLAGLFLSLLPLALGAPALQPELNTLPNILPVYPKQPVLDDISNNFQQMIGHAGTIMDLENGLCRIVVGYNEGNSSAAALFYGDKLIKYLNTKGPYSGEEEGVRIISGHYENVPGLPDVSGFWGATLRDDGFEFHSTGTYPLGEGVEISTRGTELCSSHSLATFEYLICRVACEPRPRRRR